MDNESIVKVLRTVYDRLYKMNDFESDWIRKRYFATDGGNDLDPDVCKLFAEHIAVTSLCNDVYALMSSIETFNL